MVWCWLEEDRWTWSLEPRGLLWQENECMHTEKSTTTNLITKHQRIKFTTVNTKVKNASAFLTKQFSQGKQIQKHRVARRRIKNVDNFEMLHTKYKDRLTHPGSDTLYNNCYMRHLKDVDWSSIVLHWASQSIWPPSLHHQWQALCSWYFHALFFNLSDVFMKEKCQGEPK